MSKNDQLVFAFPPMESRFGAEPRENDDPDRCEGRGTEQIHMNLSRKTGESRVPAEKKEPIPQSHRELALAIFERCDPVAVGRDLIENGDEKGASVRLRGLEIFADWAYGKPASATNSSPARLVWDLPLRRDGAQNAETETSEGGVA